MPEINTAHLDHLYEEVVIETGDTVGIIHIYAEAPDYHFVGDDDEGIACLDDATRAAIFYLNQSRVTGDRECFRKAKMLMRFTLALQSDNGYFYNFIWEDGTIHRTGVTTYNEPRWWSWRSLWCLSEFIASGEFDSDPMLAQMTNARKKLVARMLSDQDYDRTYDSVEGISVPEWLPENAATDQAALILMGIAPVYKSEPGIEIQSYIELMADGILTAQVDAPSLWFDGSFLCWQNLWHGYGSSQAYALLVAGETMNNSRMRDAALYEVNNFYPALWKKGWLSSFKVREVGDRFEAYELYPFDQIAYAIRPAIYASAKAYMITGESKYKVQAAELFSWFTGNNPAGAIMYDEHTGRGYDGISSAEKVNFNSGAESTVEALLALQMLHSIHNN